MYNRQPPHGSTAYPVGQPASPQEDVDRIDLRELFLKVWRRKALLLVCMLIGALVFGFAVSQVTPKYTALAKVMLDPRKSRIVTDEAVLSDLDVTDQVVNSEVAVLRSNVLIERVVEELGFERLALLDAARPSLTSRLKSLVGLGAPAPDASTTDILRAQTDLMVLAMACGLTRVGVIQASHHTSELIMSRFAGSEMYDPGYDMRSHQASHYGARHDRSNRNFVDYLAQRRWWVGKYRALLERLAAIPEGDGSMLDYTLVLFCTEVSDGNTHSHHDMPFVLAGNAAGTIATGRVMETGGRRHGDLLAALATAMGEPLAGFGWESREALPGLITG